MVSSAFESTTRLTLHGTADRPAHLRPTAPAAPATSPLFFRGSGASSSPLPPGASEDWGRNESKGRGLGRARLVSVAPPQRRRAAASASSATIDGGVVDREGAVGGRRRMAVPELRGWWLRALSWGLGCCCYQLPSRASTRLVPLVPCEYDLSMWNVLIVTGFFFANNNLNVTEGELRHLFLDRGSIKVWILNMIFEQKLEHMKDYRFTSQGVQWQQLLVILKIESVICSCIIEVRWCGESSLIHFIVSIYSELIL
jgi:hypothetical protein